MHGTPIQIENFFACCSLSKNRDASITASQIYARLGRCRTKNDTFYKMFTWCGGTIACLSTILIYETQIGPFLRNIFAAYSVMRETFTQVYSSISVQLVTGAAPG
jgi:hypothetical protein